MQNIKPSDEKFHLYYLGRATLTRECVFWAHESWGIQLSLERYYRPGQNNTFDIYASVRLEGPSYIKGSKKIDKVSVDRILMALVEDKK
jgi:hypothetical protein